MIMGEGGVGGGVGGRGGREIGKQSEGSGLCSFSECNKNLGKI